MYEQPRNVAIMKGRKGIARKVKKDRVTIAANKLRNEIKVNNGRQLIKKWNDRTKFIPRENPGNFNSKIIPRENPNINIQNTRPSRSIVNSTKVSMRVKIKN